VSTDLFLTALNLEEEGTLFSQHACKYIPVYTASRRSKTWNFINIAARNSNLATVITLYQVDASFCIVGDRTCSSSTAAYTRHRSMLSDCVRCSVHCTKWRLNGNVTSVCVGGDVWRFKHYWKDFGKILCTENSIKSWSVMFVSVTAGLYCRLHKVTVPAVRLSQYKQNIANLSFSLRLNFCCLSLTCRRTPADMLMFFNGFCPVHCNTNTQRWQTKCTFYEFVLQFLILLVSTCFEPKDSSSGRQLYTQLWCGTFYMHEYQQSCW